jgi:hypothetical protein
MRYIQYSSRSLIQSKYDTMCDLTNLRHTLYHELQILESLYVFIQPNNLEKVHMQVCINQKSRAIFAVLLVKTKPNFA